MDFPESIVLVAGIVIYFLAILAIKLKKRKNEDEGENIFKTYMGLDKERNIEDIRTIFAWKLATRSSLSSLYVSSLAIIISVTILLLSLSYYMTIPNEGLLFFFMVGLAIAFFIDNTWDLTKLAKSSLEGGDKDLIKAYVKAKEKLKKDRSQNVEQE